MAQLSKMDRIDLSKNQKYLNSTAFLNENNHYVVYLLNRVFHFDQSNKQCTFWLALGLLPSLFLITIPACTATLRSVFNLSCHLSTNSLFFMYITLFSNLGSQKQKQSSSYPIMTMQCPRLLQSVQGVGSVGGLKFWSNAITGCPFWTYSSNYSNVMFYRRKNSNLSESPCDQASCLKPFQSMIGPVPFPGMVPLAFIISDSLAYKVKQCRTDCMATGPHVQVVL